MLRAVIVLSSLVAIAPALAAYHQPSKAERLADATERCRDAGVPNAKACGVKYEMCLSDVSGAVSKGGGPVTNAVFNICDEQIGLRWDQPDTTGAVAQ